MKSKIKKLIIFALIIFSVPLTEKLSAQQSQISFQVFYDQLSPYGQWVDYPNYGYVWVPDGGSDFAPYSTAGHWVFTDYGWTWVSDYDWGWAPFHYGRWDYDNFYGWFWVPDNEWGPAWVNWRSADGYYGWEPMQPGVTITIGFHREYNDRNDHWIFVKDRDIDRPHINLYFVNNRSDHDRIIRDSRVIRNTYEDKNRNTTYVSGPDREDVRKVTGRKVKPVTIQENTNPGQNLRYGRLHIYRPQVNANNDKDQRITPSRVTNLKDLKESSERRNTNQPKNVNSSNNKQERKNAVNPQKNSRKEQTRRTRTEKGKKRTE